MKFFNAALKKRMTLRLATPYLEVLESLRVARVSCPPMDRATILQSRVSRSTITMAQAKQTIGDAKTLKLSSLINTFLLDKSYEEAKVLKSFLENFDHVEKNAKTCTETTRNFLTTLKERVMDIRYNALVDCAPAFNPAVETQMDVIGREVELCIEKSAILKLHDRILDVLAKLNKKDDQKIEAQLDRLSSKPQSYFGIPQSLEASSKWQLAVIEINEIATHFLPQEKLRAILNCIAAIVDTAQFEADRRAKENSKMSTSLSTSTLSASSSPPSISPSPSPSPSSAPSTTGCKTGASPGTPHQTDPAESTPPVTGSPSLDRARTTSPAPSMSKPVDLSADDLLPILIYVLVHSKLSRMESQCQYMWQMSDPADLVGESGYYLTMLSSAVEYLKQHEEEASAPPPSQPVSISGSSFTGGHNVNLFDDSDSEDELSPPSRSWIGSKSFLSSSTAEVTSTSTSPASPVLNARPNRQSLFVIGSTRGSSNSFFSNHRSPSSTGSNDIDSGSPTSIGNPEILSASSVNSTQSVYSTESESTSTGLSLQRSAPSSPRHAIDSSAISQNSTQPSQTPGSAKK